MICKNCNKEVLNGSMFCSFCGTKMEDSNIVNSNIQTPIVTNQNGVTTFTTPNVNIKQQNLGNVQQEFNQPSNMNQPIMQPQMQSNNSSTVNSMGSNLGYGTNQNNMGNIGLNNLNGQNVNQAFYQSPTKPNTNQNYANQMPPQINPIEEKKDKTTIIVIASIVVAFLLVCCCCLPLGGVLLGM